MWSLVQDCAEKSTPHPVNTPAVSSNMVAEHGCAPGNREAVGSGRVTRKVFAGVDHKDDQQAGCARECAAQVKAELQMIHDGVLALMDKDLIPLASTRESNELYLKMKGDSCRHLAEFGTGGCREEGRRGRAAYESTKVIQKVMVGTHPTQATLMLNFSVCQCEVLQDLDEACKMARVAFDVEDSVEAARGNAGAHR